MTCPRPSRTARPCSTGRRQSSPSRDPCLERLAEATNLLVKKIKCWGHGFNSFRNWRLHVLLPRGRIKWNAHPARTMRGRSPQLIASSQQSPSRSSLHGARSVSVERTTTRTAHRRAVASAANVQPLEQHPTCEGGPSVRREPQELCSVLLHNQRFDLLAKANLVKIRDPSISCNHGMIRAKQDLTSQERVRILNQQRRKISR